MKLNIMLFLVFVLLLAGCSNIQGCLFPGKNVSDVGNETISNNSVLTNDSFEIVLDENSEIILDEEEQNEEETELNAEDSLFILNVKEGETVSLKVKAEDPDGDDITYTYSNPLNNDGEWNTKIGDAGSYLVTVSASDGLLTTTETIKIIVESVNKAPVILCKDSIIVKEGDLIDLTCSFTDADGDKVNYQVKGFMNDLTYQTTYDDAGEYEVTVVATDGLQSVQKEILVKVENVNRVPEIKLDSKTMTISEKDTAKINVEVIDLDDDEISLSFSEPFNANGEWETELGDAGTYEITIIADDGSQAVKEIVNVVVTEFNAAPIIKIDKTLTYKEGDLITLPLTVEDTNGDEVAITISGFMTGLTYQTTYDDAGEYTVTIKANDGVNEVTKVINVIVENVNRPPVFIVG
jgi:hypothetical protein